MTLSPGVAKVSADGAVAIEHMMSDLNGVTLERTDPHGATLASGVMIAAPDRNKLDPTKVVLTPNPHAPAGAERSHVFMRLRDSKGVAIEIQLWDEAAPKGLKGNRR